MSKHLVAILLASTLLLTFAFPVYGEAQTLSDKVYEQGGTASELFSLGDGVDMHILKRRTSPFRQEFLDSIPVTGGGDSDVYCNFEESCIQTMHTQGFDASVTAQYGILYKGAAATSYLSSRTEDRNSRTTTFRVVAWQLVGSKQLPTPDIERQLGPDALTEEKSVKLESNQVDSKELDLFKGRFGSEYVDKVYLGAQVEFAVRIENSEQFDSANIRKTLEMSFHAPSAGAGVNTHMNDDLANIVAHTQVVVHLSQRGGTDRAKDLGSFNLNHGDFASLMGAASEAFADALKKPAVVGFQTQPIENLIGIPAQPFRFKTIQSGWVQKWFEGWVNLEDEVDELNDIPTKELTPEEDEDRYKLLRAYEQEEDQIGAVGKRLIDLSPADEDKLESESTIDRLSSDLNPNKIPARPGALNLPEFQCRDWRDMRNTPFYKSLRRNHPRFVQIELISLDFETYGGWQTNDITLYGVTETGFGTPQPTFVDFVHGVNTDSRPHKDRGVLRTIILPPNWERLTIWATFSGNGHPPVQYAALRLTPDTFKDPNQTYATPDGQRLDFHIQPQGSIPLGHLLVKLKTVD